MLAHHPTTGQSIRIIRTETQIASTLKTLVWIQPTFKASHRWSRWFPIISDPKSYRICKTNLVALVISPNSNIEEWKSIIPFVFQSSPDCLCIAPQSIIERLEKDCNFSFALNQTLIWEELFESYPYLGEPVKSSDPLEKIIISIAHILRMNRIVWSSSFERETMQFSTRMQYDAWIKLCKGSIMRICDDSDDSCIPQTWLVQQYFQHSSNRRNREIFTCLEKNIACPWIDHIVLLNEQEYKDIPTHPKLQIVPLSNRLTYYNVLNYAKSNLPKNDFLIFANSDIYFGDTLAYLWRIPIKEQSLFLALLRWEDNIHGEPHIFGPRADSQDSWIIANDNLSFNITEEEFDFPFGKSGCDNAIALIMMRKKFIVTNPAYSIKTFHLHNSNIRTYDPKDVLYRPHYLYIDPSAIQFLHIQKNLNEYSNTPAHIMTLWSKRVLGQSFTRAIHGLAESDIKTVCAMLKQSEQPYTFLHNDNNLWTPTPIQQPLYKFSNCFVSCEGLVSSFLNIYVGCHKGWLKGWEKAQQSTVMQSIHIPNIIAIPYDGKYDSLSQWVLHYLPLALTLRSILKYTDNLLPEFLVPQLSDIVMFLEDLNWPEKGNITVNPMIDTMNYYANTVWAVPPSDEDQFVTKEDIDSLRMLLPNHKKVNQGPVAVFCVSDNSNDVLTRGWAEETAEHILSKGWSIRYISDSDQPSVRRKAFAEASWIFGMGEALNWIWYASPGTTVMEFMSESAPIGEHIHLAGASSLRYIAGLIKREQLPYQRQNALMDVGKAIQLYGFQESLESVRSNPIIEIPTVVLPFGKGLDGIWNHSGDTFREMVQIWGERGYVRIENNEGTKFCWWGSIGEVLLYDRPTKRWWSDVPSYQMALFGNCAPPGPDNHFLRQSTWCFWPRSPKHIESLNIEKKNTKGYNERSISSLFIGKVENGVQLQQRGKHNWSKSLELFSMPIDSTGKDYPYTQKEYLEKLCDARFGLCLPGFGNKCNREIEYFATGCVPIITEGVDMINYLVPPREGIHYFVANNPEDVTRIVKTTTSAKWLEMSIAGRNWWNNVASAEGLFRLTWARIEQCRPYLNVGIPKTLQ